MEASITLVVRLAGDTPAGGAQVRGINHDAVSEAHRDWAGTTDAQGRLTWPNVDLGPLGDRFTITARFVDATGEKWYAETSERIFSPTTITLDIV